MNTAETMVAMAPGPTKARSPNGCSRQVMTQVTPEEHQQISAVAKREGRSVSSTVRLLTLRGLEHYRADSSDS
ncbi:MAG: hypothetical protein ABN479_19710 [Billgrantia sp.]